MYGICCYIWLIFMVNVGKYTNPMDPMGYATLFKYAVKNTYQSLFPQRVGQIRLATKRISRVVFFCRGPYQQKNIYQTNKNLMFSKQMLKKNKNIAPNMASWKITYFFHRRYIDSFMVVFRQFLGM